MKKDIILNFRSLLTIKDRINFSIDYSFDIKRKLIKINNSIYLKDRIKFQITQFFKETHNLKTTNIMAEHRLPIFINHTIFEFYIKKYDIKNKYLIENISEFYRLTKSFIKMFNIKYINEIPNEIEVNHDVVFSILKYNESKIKDLEKYKKEKIENVFSEELFGIIRRL